MVNVEEDYQVCVRTLSRARASAAEPTKKTRRGYRQDQMQLVD